MVFVWLVNKIAGIFKKYEVDISESGSDKEFDKVIEIIHEGFLKVQGRFKTVDDEINSIRNAVLLKEDHINMHESLQQDILSNKSQYDSLLNSIHHISNRIDAVEQNNAVSDNSVNDSSKLREELYGLYQTLDAKVRSFDSTLHNEIALNVTSVISTIEDNISKVDLKNSLLMDEVKSLKKQLELSINPSVDLNSNVQSFILSEVSRAVNEVFSKISNDKVSTLVDNNDVVTQSNNVTSQINNVTTTRQSTEVGVGGINNVTTAFKPTRTVITSRNLNKVLPSALIPAFNELLNADNFLSYSSLAKLLDKREATARAYVNDLRNRGVAIEEETRENGRKLVRLAKDIRQEYIIPE